MFGSLFYYRHRYWVGHAIWSLLNIFVTTELYIEYAHRLGFRSNVGWDEFWPSSAWYSFLHHGHRHLQFQLVASHYRHGLSVYHWDWPNAHCHRFQFPRHVNTMDVSLAYHRRRSPSSSPVIGLVWSACLDGKSGLLVAECLVVTSLAELSPHCLRLSLHRGFRYQAGTGPPSLNGIVPSSPGSFQQIIPEYFQSVSRVTYYCHAGSWDCRQPPRRRSEPGSRIPSSLIVCLMSPVDVVTLNTLHVMITFRLEFSHAAYADNTNGLPVITVNISWSSPSAGHIIFDYYRLVVFWIYHTTSPSLRLAIFEPLLSVD